MVPPQLGQRQGGEQISISYDLFRFCFWISVFLGSGRATAVQWPGAEQGEQSEGGGLGDAEDPALGPLSDQSDEHVADGL